MNSIDLYDNMLLGSIRTPMGDLTVTAYHNDNEHFDLYVDLERYVDGAKQVMQVCVVTVCDYADEVPSMCIYPYNTTDEVTDDCDENLIVRTDDDRWYR